MPATAQPLRTATRPPIGASQLLDRGFIRRAGRATLLAVAALLSSAAALSLYFGGAGEIFGPINDALIAATFALLAPAVLAVQKLGRDDTGRWLYAVSAATLAGIGIAATGQLLLIAGVISLAGSFVTLGAGALAVMAWIGVLATVALRHGLLARSVGWWALALIAASAVTAVGTPLSGLETAALSVVFGIPLLVATVGLLASLGLNLLRRG